MNRRNFLAFVGSLPLAGALANRDDIPGDEGDERTFVNQDGFKIKCRLARNTSGKTLLPNRVVAWKGGSNWHVGGYFDTTTLPMAMAGIVLCPRGGVANGRLFWVATHGMVKVVIANMKDVVSV